MAMVEVDENVLVNNRKLVETVQKMLANPKSRQLVLNAHKIVDPSVSIPEIDARAPVEQAIGGLNKKLDDFIAAQNAQRAKETQDRQREQFVSKFEAGRAALKNDHGMTDEGLKKVEDLMQQAGIVDHAIGYAAWSKLNPEPEPAPPAPNFGFGGIFSDASKNPDEFIKAMHASKGNDEAALDKRIHEVLVETRQQNGRPQQIQGRR